MTTLCLVKYIKVRIYYHLFPFVQATQVESLLFHSHFHRASLRSLTKALEVWFYG